MHVTFMVTARCNARCSHCSTSCGPERTECLPGHRIRALMDEAAVLAADEPLEFGITGGEPFLDFELLRDIVSHGKSLGAGIACVSNAYWASSDDKATRIVQAIKQAGLDLLALSTSRFHQEFVKRSRVERALRICRSIGLRTQLKYVRTERDPEPAQIEAWAAAAGAASTQVIPLLPTLRAGASAADSEFPRSARLPRGRCPAALLNVSETGEAYMCCTPGACHPFFSLGNVQTERLGEIHTRFLTGGKQAILRRLGPAWFARQVREEGQGSRLRSHYASVCDLCTHIAQDPIMADVAERAASRFEMRQLTRILDRLVEHAAPAYGANEVDCAQSSGGK